MELKVSVVSSNASEVNKKSPRTPLELLLRLESERTFRRAHAVGIRAKDLDEILLPSMACGTDSDTSTDTGPFSGTSFPDG
jgi:hypothetical protein